MAHPHRSLRLRVARTLVVLGLLFMAVAGSTRAAGREVVVLSATGVIDDALAGYLAEGVAGAARSGAAAVVVELNTPGGSLDATQRITAAFLDAQVPVIVWVAPSGARAASAGTFVTLAANLSFMAPGTNIGAASPVSSSGEDIGGTLGVKVMNDAVANITSIAEARGRPVDWAASTVKNAASYSAQAAIAAHAVDGTSDSIDAVLAAANGCQVTVHGGTSVTLDLTGATIVDAPMNPLTAFLHVLSDPNIAFILFVTGALLIALELIHTNLVTGVIGAFTLILAFIGFGSLPLNLAGLLLVGFGFVLFVLETQIISHGLLTLAGVVAIALGASALYTPPVTPTGPLVQVAPPLIVAVTLTAAILMALISIAAVRTRRMKGSAGTVGVPVAPGTTGVVQAPLDPLGTVHLAGETWSARTRDGRLLLRDTPVRLVGFDRLVAIVEPLAADEPLTALPAAPLPGDRT